MSVLAFLLILSVGADASIAPATGADGVVFRCAFGEAWDANFDGWPDHWSRRRGRGFPEYVPVKIVPAPHAPAGTSCLEVDLDGGAVAAYSPAIAIGPSYSYVLEGTIWTQGLHFDQAKLSLTILDRNRHRLESHDSDGVGGTSNWQTVRLGPIAPSSPDARQAVIGLHVEHGQEADIKGRARFGDVRLVRMPRVTLWADNRLHLFTDPSKVVIHCKASGFSGTDPSVKLRLEDALGNQLAETSRRLETTTDTAGDALSMDDAQPRAAALIGTTDWTPPLAQPGFYRVEVELEGHDGPVDGRDMTFAVIQPQRIPQGGEFGWTLPRGGRPLKLFELSQVVTQAGINWLKMPIWFGAKTDEEQIERLVRFGERLGLLGIQLVGLLDDPPDEVSRHFGNEGAGSAAVVFSAPAKLWRPSIESVLIRMANQVRWWQIGDDKDSGFVNYPNLAKKIAQIKTELDQSGYGVNLGFGWQWLNQLPQSPQAEPPWQFLALSTDPPLTEHELLDYLAATKDSPAKRWVVLQPLDESHYSTETRILDLVKRMMAAKIRHADGIFVPDVIDPERGLLRDDGTPGELFLPWRTTALVLGGKTDLGSIQLPAQSHNRVFARGNDAVMVVWNKTPAEEVIYLGEKVRQVNLWGQQTQPPRRDQRQVIQVGPLPTFLIGVDPQIARWRQQTELVQDRIPSVFGRRYPSGIRMKNTFSEPVSGVARLVAPKVWELQPDKLSFQLDRNQSYQEAFQISLPYTAVGGRHPLRIDLEIVAGEPKYFSVYRYIQVGLDDVDLRVLTRLGAGGELEIEQQFINETSDPVSFRLYLYAPDRRRRKTEVIGLEHGRDLQTIRLPNGQELLGKTLWIRAEEIGGKRVLNRQFVAKP